jgi:hypothetical protein
MIPRIVHHEDPPCLLLCHLRSFWSRALDLPGLNWPQSRVEAAVRGFRQPLCDRIARISAYAVPSPSAHCVMMLAWPQTA